MNIKELICKKKLEELSVSDFAWLVGEVVKDKLSERQILDFIKVVDAFGFSNDEVYKFAMAMASGGDKLDISKDVGFCVDKQSLGTVSDASTLIVASALSALNINFVKSVSSVYNGYGSLLDRLNSFKGFNCKLTREQLIDNIKKCKVGIIDGQGKIAPAADVFYKVCKKNNMLIEPIESVLILANKIAIGASMCVVDIKQGEGAFAEMGKAEKLAERLQVVGQMAGITIMSVITDLNWPISASVGTSLEVQEIKDTLSSSKEYPGSNLLKLAKEMVICVLLATEMATGRSQASEMFDEAVSSGKVYEKFCSFLDIYGGDVTSVSRTVKLIDTAVTYITAGEDGYISDIILSKIYSATNELIGSGANVDQSAGLVLMCGEGDKVVVGQKLAKVFYSHNNPRYFKVSANLFGSFIISKEKITTNNLFYKVVV